VVKTQKIYVLPQNLKNDNFDDQTVKKSNLPKINFTYSLFHKKKSFYHKKYYVISQICAKKLNFSGKTASFCVKTVFSFNLFLLFLTCKISTCQNTKEMRFKWV
jgi:hypothetical protein